MASGTKDRERPDADRRRLTRAVQHPLRAQVHSELSRREMSTAELTAQLRVGPGLIAYHHRVLDRLGMLPDPPELESP